MQYRFEGDYFSYSKNCDNLEQVIAMIQRSRQAYSTKAHPEDKVANTWISRRIRRVYDDSGTLIFPPKKTKSSRINKEI